MVDKSRIHALILPRTGFCKTDSLALAAAVLGPLVVYVLTLSHTVALEDDGLFLMAGAHLGIAHPPGYPIYTLILHLFMQLPFGTPAFLGHLSSAVLGALACGGVYLCARLLGAAALPALAAAWLFGVSEHVWSQSIIAEVYALNSLFFFAVYALLLYGLRGQQRLWVWIAAAACYGMSLANHWPLMVLATPGLFLLILPARKAMFRRLPMLSGVATLGAVVPYVWMFLRAQQSPKISFYGSMNGLGDLWYHISRKGYSHFYKSSAGLDDHLGFLQWFAGEIMWQLTLPAFFLAILGLAVLLRRRQLAEAGSGLVVFLGQSLVLIMLISFHFNYIQLGMFRPYSLVCYGLLAIWSAVGFQVLMDHLRPWSHPDQGRKPTLHVALAAVLSLAMVAFSVQENWRKNGRSASDFPKEYAEMMFRYIEPDAIMLASNDLETGVLGYYHLVENCRPDITLLHRSGLVYNRQFNRPRMPQKEKRKILREFISKTDRPVFFSSGTRRDFCPGCEVRNYGFIKKVVRDGTPRREHLLYRPEGERRFKELLLRKPADAWERYTRNNLLRLYGDYLGKFISSNNPEWQGWVEHLVPLAEQDFYTLTSMMEAVFLRWDAEHLEQAKGWVKQAEHLRLRESLLLKRDESKFLYLKGFVLFQSGDKDAAAPLFRKSVAIYNHPENRARRMLKKLEEAAGQ